MLSNITTLGGATAIRHIAAVRGAMFRATVMCSSARMRRTIDGIAAFRRHRQVFVTVRGVTDMGFGRRI